MEQKPSLDKEERTCSRCGEKLTYFIAYIPGEGEACMKCYTECAKEKELIR